MKLEATPWQWFLKIRLQAAEKSGRILNLLYRREVGQDWPRFKPRASNWERRYWDIKTTVAILRILNTVMRIRTHLFTSLRTRIRLFTLMRIRILLLPTEVIQIYDHWFTDPPRSPPQVSFCFEPQQKAHKFDKFDPDPAFDLDSDQYLSSYSKQNGFMRIRNTHWDGGYELLVG